MVAVRLTNPFRLVMVGSPDYLARYGRPRKPADLASHSCVRMRRSNGALAHWRVRGNPGPLELAVSGPLVVNDVPSMLAAALGDVGLAQVPEPIARKHLASGQLEEVLGDHAPSSPGVFLYFPSRTQVLPKLRAFIDHAKSYAAAVLLRPAGKPSSTKSPQPATRRKR
jgi:DNA-binding transcriptional LysR family regulator